VLDQSTRAEILKLHEQGHSIRGIDTGTITVFFDDGTRWISVNHRYGRPAAEPGKWTKISFEEWAGKQKSAE